MPIEEVRLELLPRFRRGVIFEKMREWAGLRDRVLDSRIPANSGLVVTLSPESMAMTRQKNLHQLVERFRMAFVSKFPEAEYRYKIRTCNGKIVVVGNPHRNGKVVL